MRELFLTQINTIIFDLGSVLIDWNPYPVILKAFDNNEEKANWFLNNICHPEWNGTLDAGKNFELAKKEKSAEYPEYAKYIAIYVDQWEDMLMGEIKGTVNILRELKESGAYRLLAITNWSAEKFPIGRKRYPFLGWFEDIIISGEIGMIKPDRKIYAYALQRFNLTSPESAVFIDDRLENIETAAEFGIKGIHYKNPKQLKSDLKNLGIHLNSNNR